MEKMRTSSYFITRSLDAKQGLDLGLVIRIRYLDFIGKPVGTFLCRFCFKRYLYFFALGFL